MTSPDIKRSYVRRIYNQRLQNKSVSKWTEHFTQNASIIKLLQARINIQSTHGKSKDCTLSNLRPYKMNKPSTDATKCDTSVLLYIQRCPPGDKCQLLQGSCSLVAPCPSCSCLHLLPEQFPVQQKDWRYLEVFEGNISNTSNHLTWSHLHFLSHSLIGLITRLCRLHYKMTCTCHRLPPTRQHPWFGSKNALLIHKVVRDWPLWKHLTFIAGWSRVGHGWHTMGQATSPGLVPSPSGFSRILCSLWA